MQIILSTSEAQTRAAGRALGESLTGGVVVALKGDLGAGKTVFAKGIADGLGIAAHVTSPTFTLLNVYEGDKLTLCHADCYRLKGDDVFGTGLTDYLGADGTVCVIEWPERIAALLDEQTVTVSIRMLDGETREIIIDDHE